MHACMQDLRLGVNPSPATVTTPLPLLSLASGRIPQARGSRPESLLPRGQGHHSHQSEMLPWYEWQHLESPGPVTVQPSCDCSQKQAVKSKTCKEGKISLNCSYDFWHSFRWRQCLRLMHRYLCLTDMGDGDLCTVNEIKAGFFSWGIIN